MGIQNLIDSLLYNVLELLALITILWKIHSYGKRLDELERNSREKSTKDPDELERNSREKSTKDPDEFWRKYLDTKPK